MQLLRTCKRRDYTLGDKLTSQGSKGSSLMLIFSGEASLSVAASEASSHHHHHPRASSPPPAAASSPPAPLSPSAADAEADAMAKFREDGHTPRDVPLRSVGPGQVIPCTAAAAGLHDGCIYPMASRVASSHCQVGTA